MIAEYFCKGLLIGFIFGVPAGAIGALTIGRTLDKGFTAGQNILQIIGGILILLLGFSVLCKKKAAVVQCSAVQKESKGTLAFCFQSAFTTALVNPATILSFMTAFAAFGIQGGLDAGQGTVLIIGIFTGTLCWWLALSGITAHFRDRVTGKIYRWLNCILGCLMIGFGIIMAVISICLISVLAGCGSLTSKEEPQQSIADMGSDYTGQPEVEVQGSMETGEFMPVQENTEQVQNEQLISSELEEENSLETGEMNILMKIDDETVAVEWEDNESVSALAELLREQPLSIQMSMYGDFEQVGSLGTSLPREDEQTTTQAGDIVLYSGSQIVVFYGSNSWAYTRLGRITDKSTEELVELLGSGDVTITLELR